MKFDNLQSTTRMSKKEKKNQKKKDAAKVGELASPGKWMGWMEQMRSFASNT